MYLSPDALRSLIADTPVEAVEVEPRRGVSREGVAFPMGHQLAARFEDSKLMVTIDRTRIDERYAVRWGFEAVPPVTLLARRRAPLVVRGRGISTGSRAFDRAFKLTCEADVAKRVLDRAFAERLAATDPFTLDGVIAIGEGAPGLPGFGVLLTVAPRPDAIAHSFAITRELRTRIFGAGV